MTIRTPLLATTLVAVLLVASRVAAAGEAAGETAPPPDNPNIDMAGFLRAADEAAALRPERRLGEADFLKAAREPGTIVLDARSRDKYDELHVRGALSLPFPDITIESLARLIPDKDTRILVYCNNNFRNADLVFASKLPSASLNLSTWISLTSYGYRNVWELGPYVDIDATILPFDGTAAREGKARLPLVQSPRPPAGN